MATFFKLIVVVFFLTLNINTVTANQAGKNQHDSKCLSCHTTSVYSRSDRKVKSLDALSQRVNMCVKGGARANWDSKQIDNVTDYLNKQFYKF